VSAGGTGRRTFYESLTALREGTPDVSSFGGAKLVVLGCLHASADEESASGCGSVTVRRKGYSSDGELGSVKCLHRSAHLVPQAYVDAARNRATRLVVRVGLRGSVAWRSYAR
jgi:hypothetical protein